MPIVYNMQFGTVESIEESTDLEGLSKFKDKLDKDITELLKLQEAVAKQIREMSTQGLNLSKEDFLKRLEQIGLRSFNLEECFARFEREYLEGMGSTELGGELVYREFDYFTEDDKSVKVDIAIQHKFIDEEDCEYFYSFRV